MERLTVKSVLGGWTTRMLKQEAVDRLAAYEDTGLAPEEIEQTLMNFSTFLMEMTGGMMSKTNYTVQAMISETNDHFQAICDECGDREELQAYRASGLALADLPRAAELVKADDEGRLTILPLPAKEDDPKPECFYDDGASLWCLGYANEGDDEPTDRCKQCWYCESGDYADDRAEAEAALGGGGSVR